MRGVATMANSVGGHYSRSMLNKFKCLFCKYVNGITDGHSQSRMQASREEEGEKREEKRARVRWRARVSTVCLWGQPFWHLASATLSSLYFK